MSAGRLLRHGPSKGFPEVLICMIDLSSHAQPKKGNKTCHVLKEFAAELLLSSLKRYSQFRLPLDEDWSKFPIIRGPIFGFPL